MNPLSSILLAAGIPTLAVIIAIVRNESAIAALAMRITRPEQRIDARIQTLDRDFARLGQITMGHNSDIGRL